MQLVLLILVCPFFTAQGFCLGTRLCYKSALSSEEAIYYMEGPVWFIIDVDKVDIQYIQNKDCVSMLIYTLDGHLKVIRWKMDTMQV